MYYLLGHQPTLQSLSFTDSQSVALSTPYYCGSFEYRLSPVKNFIALADNALSLYTSDASDVGSYQVQLQVTLHDYPTIIASFMINATIKDCFISEIIYSAESTFTYEIGSGP